MRLAVRASRKSALHDLDLGQDGVVLGCLGVLARVRAVLAGRVLSAARLDAAARLPGPLVAQDRVADVTAQGGGGGRGDADRGRDGVAGLLQQEGEAEPVHVQAGMGGDRVGGGTDQRLIGRQQAPDLLVDPVDAVRAQHTAVQHGGLDRKIRGLHLPPFMVKIHQLPCREPLVVGQAGDQPPLLAPGGAVLEGDGDPCLDDADGEVPVAGAGPVDRAADPGQVGTVRQPVLDDRTAPGAGAHQELRAARGDLAQQLVAVEGGVGQQQHRFVQRAQQPPRVAALALALGTERGGQQGPGAALHQHQQPQQRVAELQGVPDAFGIPPGDLLVLGHVQMGAVQRDRAQAAVVHARPVSFTHRPGQNLKQRPQRARAQAPPGPRERGHRRSRAGREAESAGQLAPHRPVGAALEQGHRKHEIDHHPGGQQPPPLLPRAGLLQGRVHQRGVHGLRQLAQMPRREHPRPGPGLRRDGRLLLQRDSR